MKTYIQHMSRTSSRLLLIGFAIVSASCLATSQEHPCDPCDHKSIAASEAILHIGEHVTVRGTVVSTKFAEADSNQPTFLNLDWKFPNQIFTAVIWNKDRRKFGTPEVDLLNKGVCVTGRIVLYKRKDGGIERPEVFVSDTSQLSVMK